MSEAVESGLSENSIGALAYFTLIPGLLFLAIAPYNRSSYIRFHAWQSIVVSVIAFFVDFLAGEAASMVSPLNPMVVLSVHGVVLAAFVLVSVWCMISALNGKRFELPGIGAWAERQSNK